MTSALFPYRSEILEIYQDTQSFRETARQLSDLHPELPGWNWLRELVNKEIKIYKEYYILNAQNFFMPTLGAMI